MEDIFDLSLNEEGASASNLSNNSSSAAVYNNTATLTMQSFPWLEQLNPEQKQATTTTEGPVLVLSGAGTGKTKVLTSRLAYILASRKANPWECLVVTFTNRAAKEMKERVYNLIGELSTSVWLGTFHAICVKILRRHAELVGLNSNFTILNEDDQKRLVKQICEAEGIDDKKYPPQSIVDSISRWKDKGLTIEKIKQEYKSNILTLVFEKYQKRLIELDCVDFGDIILHTLTILMSYPDILSRYQNQFKYIMVDEYQDTNVSQYLLLRLLSQKHRNLCCVGDDDQSIYSWRGAEIENILRFSKDFADAQTIRLERNYRSTANILSAASALIKHNEGRLGKTLKVAENSPALAAENSKIKVISTYSGEDEAALIANEIELHHKSGMNYADMAVLVRTAFQTREFEERFISESIPYQVIGGPKFYERAEIRDAIAYFRVVLQPHDDLALERIINKPARGIGAKSVEKFYQTARSEHISLYMAIEKLLAEGGVSGKAKTSLAELTEHFKDWRLANQSITPDELAQLILDDSGYLESLKNDKSPDAPARIENLKELINVMSNHEKFPTLSDFMEHVSLVMENDDNQDTNKVTLMTLHSAKGLEFELVFLPGWEEGLFPHQRSLDEGGSNSLEEERRLAYVAITRAKKELYITTALNRRVYGQWQNNIPSRFINELPPQNIELINKTANYFQRQDTYGGSSSAPWSSSRTNNRNDFGEIEYSDGGGYTYTKEYQNSYAGYNSWAHINKAKQAAKNATSDILIGARVFHESFGYGRVKNIEGNKLEIIFDKAGYKKLMKNYVQKIK